MFKKGQSGNPTGRPKGALDKRREYKQYVKPHAGEMLKKAVDMALNGNEMMLKLILSRFLPAVPSEPEISNSIKLEGSISDKASYIIESMADGTITLKEGSTLLDALKSQYELDIFSHFETRFNELEQKYEYRFNQIEDKTAQ